MYTLLQVLGEGGFGVVYLAERREPMVQRVALKIIKPGMDSKAVVARFEQERQALAVMDHPNVARVFDGGVTPSGRPYFVMEHVQGEPITRFADRGSLTLRQRLELFIPVCEAVQHAHHKGLIHRDIKPSNVLVAEIDGKPVAKVIDFGVAKAIASEGWAYTAHTQSGMVIGTPEYMSPEQVAGEIDVDTRADVYSLGVLLYELLTGELPFDSRELRKVALAEIQRIIREVTPPKPSTRLAQLAGERTTTIAQARSTSSDRMASELRRELDWIPLMALRKERERRYDSPQALADDVRRYLDGRPLLAAPDSRAYLARKFVKRNKVQVLAASAVFLALSAGLAVALWQRSEAIQSQRAEAKERARADDRALAAEKAEKAEKERADQLKQVSDFQSQMLSQIDTTKAGIDLMADVRERFVAALEKAGVPEEERTARVDALRQELVRVNATDTAAAMIDRTILKPAIKTIGEEFRDDARTDASLRQSLARLYSTIGLYDEAHPLQQSALATRRRVLGEEHPETLTSLSDMAMLLQYQGNFKEAEPYCRDALDKRRRLLGQAHPDTLHSLNNLGLLLRNLGRSEEAEQIYREALDIRYRVLGEENQETLRSRTNLASLLFEQGRLADAEPYMRGAVETSRRVMGDEHPDTLRAIAIMGVLLYSQEKFAEGEQYLSETLEKHRRVMGEEHPDTLHCINYLGSLFNAQQRYNEATPLLRNAFELRRRVLGEEHPDTLISTNNLGILLLAQGEFSESAVLFRAAHEQSRRLQGEEHPDTLVYAANLGRALHSQGKYRETIDLLAPNEPAVRIAFVNDNALRFAIFLATLGRARVGLGHDPERFGLAESDLLEAHPILVRSRGEAHKDTRACVQGLVDLYTAWHTAEPGKGYDLKANEWRQRLPPP